MRSVTCLFVLVSAAALLSGCDDSLSAGDPHAATDAAHITHDHPPVTPLQADEKDLLPPFIALGKEPKTLEILLVAAWDDTNGGMNFNGKTRGEATFTVPVGWTVTASFKNRSAVPHSVVIVEPDKVREFRVGEPYFKGAATPEPEKGTTNNAAMLEFTFVADEKGKYAIACGFPTHALAGHWINLTVANADAKPTYTSGGETVEAK